MCVCLCSRWLPCPPSPLLASQQPFPQEDGRGSQKFLLSVSRVWVPTSDVRVLEMCVMPRHLSSVVSVQSSLGKRDVLLPGGGGITARAHRKPGLVGVGWHQHPLAPLGQGLQLMPLFSLSFLCHKLGQGRCCHLKMAFWRVKEKIIEGGGGRGGSRGEAGSGRSCLMWEKEK